MPTALIADFHARSPGPRAAGAPDTVLAAALQNFEQMVPLLKASPDDSVLRKLRRWSEREFAARRNAFAARKSGGFVRECHGDLHLSNIVDDGKSVPFDCIEFNDDLRWIDVVSEPRSSRWTSRTAAAPISRGASSTGIRSNRRLRRARRLRFYLVYRSLVRAKVHLMRSRIKRSEKLRLSHAARSHMQLAQLCGAGTGGDHPRPRPLGVRQDHCDAAAHRASRGGQTAFRPGAQTVTRPRTACGGPVSSRVHIAKAAAATAAAWPSSLRASQAGFPGHTGCDLSQANRA
jgi:hypothetical protein